MQERLAYEELIAAKLAQVPALPALADGIWQRISEELDRDLPTDDGGGTGGGVPPTGGSLLWPGAAVLLLAAAGLLYWYQQPATPSQSTVPATNNIAAPDSQPTNTENAEWPPGRSASAVPGQQPGPGNVGSPGAPPPADTLLPPDGREQPAGAADLPLSQPPGGQPLLPDNKPAGTTADKTVQPAPAATDTAQRRRIKGVPGINNSDYRIVPAKKDSSKNED